MSSEDFNWDADADVVLQEQPAVAVYINNRGGIIVRQHCWPDDDVHIEVRPENARRLADAILNAARAASRDPTASPPRLLSAINGEAG